MRLILEIHVSELVSWRWHHWNIGLQTYVIPCPLSTQGLLSRETNKVFSLALMQLILSQVLSDFNTILTQKSECLQGAINVESILIKWVLEESDRKFRSLQFCGEKDYVGL